MDTAAPLARDAVADLQKPICIAIHAMGGQGGGVLADWIVSLAEDNGWVAQSTSVPGVAQRTGATIYYIEMLPSRLGGNRGAPVLALTPVPGEVDIVIAAELMEAGRAIQRNFVTPANTTLIASSHRSYAVVEKIVPGNGIANAEQVLEAGRAAAKRFLYFDMAAEAERNNSVISAVLLGALAGAEVLPFDREAFEATIRKGGVGVEASLRAFAGGFGRIRQPAPLAEVAKPLPAVPQTAGHPALDRLLERVRREMPEPAHGMLFAGLRRVVDFQDVAYGDEYLDRMAALAILDRDCGGTGRDFALTAEAARQLAVAMCYDDVIRVADLKTRATRFDRVRDEVDAAPDQLVYMTEFMHPRIEEVCGTLPASLGRAIENTPWLFKTLGRVIDRGRRVKTGTVGWFLVLYVLAGMRRFRRSTLRHGHEAAHIAAWLDLVRSVAPRNYDLAVEIVKCRRLVKGYSDTHTRGLGKFDRVIAAAQRLADRPDAADWVRRLRDAALLDEEGTALDGALKTVATL
jgi:indolepyruvate ferredoxin oxidoreductase beta subunit